MKKVASFQHENIQGFRFGSNPFGKPRMFSHVYFVDGLLVDTGHSNMRQEVLSAMCSLPIEQIFITHHHEDHTGNLQQVQEQQDCATYASSTCVEMMKSPPSISPAQRLTWGDRPPNRTIVAEDRQISTSRYRFDVVPIPGHAVDMVGLHEPNEGWFFSSDLWVSSHIRYFMRSESMKQQIESLKRAQALDFDVLLCGHNPQFNNGKAKLYQKQQFMEKFYEEAATLYHQGNPSSVIMQKMELKERWSIRLLSVGELSTHNMIQSVIRDEKEKEDQQQDEPSN